MREKTLTITRRGIPKKNKKCGQALGFCVHLYAMPLLDHGQLSFPAKP